MLPFESIKLQAPVNDHLPESMSKVSSQQYRLTLLEFLHGHISSRHDSNLLKLELIFASKR